MKCFGIKKNTFGFKSHGPRFGDQGFTLYEVVIYIGLFLILSVLTVGLVFEILKTGYRVSRSREVVSSVNTVFGRLFETGRFARGIYTPASVLGSDTSQISFETALTPPASDPTTYVDFYIDNGRLFIKREGQGSQALTSERVRVTRFRVTRLNPVITSDSLRIAIRAEHRFSPSNEDSSFAATSTVTLRRY